MLLLGATIVATNLAKVLFRQLGLPAIVGFLAIGLITCVLSPLAVTHLLRRWPQNARLD